MARVVAPRLSAHLRSNIHQAAFVGPVRVHALVCTRAAHGGTARGAVRQRDAALEKGRKKVTELAAAKQAQADALELQKSRAEKAALAQRKKAPFGVGKRGGPRDSKGTATVPRKGQEVSIEHFKGHALSATSQALRQMGTGFSAVQSILTNLEKLPKDDRLSSCYARLLSTYAHQQRPSIELLEDIFSKFLSRGKPRLTHYTLMMSAYKNQKRPDDCLRVFEHLKARAEHDKSIRPDTVAYNVALQVTGRMKRDLEGAWKLFAEMKEARTEAEQKAQEGEDALVLLEDVDSDAEHMDLEKGLLDPNLDIKGKRTRRGLPLPPIPNYYTYTTLMSLMGRQKDSEKVLQLVEECTSLFGEKEEVLSAGMAALSRCGDVQATEHLYQQLATLTTLQGKKPSAAALHEVIGAHARVGNADAIRSVMERMSNNKVKIKTSARVDLMIACAMARDSVATLEAFNDIVNAGVTIDRRILMNLFDCMGYCGSPTEQEAVFQYALQYPDCIAPVQKGQVKIMLVGYSPNGVTVPLHYLMGELERAFRADENPVPGQGMFLITGADAYSWWKTPTAAGVETSRDAIRAFLSNFKPLIHWTEKQPGVFRVDQQELYACFKSRKAFVHLQERSETLVHRVRQAHGLLDKGDLARKRLPFFSQD